MNIYFNSGKKYGELFSPNFRECSIAREVKISKIEVDNYYPFWRVQLTHEIGHILHYLYISKPMPLLPQNRTDFQTFRQEVIAWRIAKSMTLPKFWDEKEALRSLKTYDLHFKINWNKLKIVAWGEGG